MVTVVTGKLLLIDDDRELTSLLVELLEPEGFLVETNTGTSKASDLAVRGEFALVVLDVMLPGTNGFEILKTIRRQSGVPVILLTARGDDIDRIVGLELGADDYVPKPFNPRELTARIRAVLRRTETMGHRLARSRLHVDDVTLDVPSRSVLKDGVPVPFTGVEFELLRALLEAAGRTVPREELAQHVLDRQFDPFDRSIDMHISKLRRKLGVRSTGEERIKTIRGIGYLYTLRL